MKSSLIKSIIFAIVFILSGCSSIDFYDKDGTEVGFLYYPPKPYLLIETKEKNQVSSIISLPDTENPHRVKQSTGWGSAILSFEIENGMIKTFNSTTDSKGPETLTALAGLGSAKAAIDTAKAAMLEAELTPVPAATSTLQSLDKKLITSIPTKYEIKTFESAFDFLKGTFIPILEKAKSTFKHELSIADDTKTKLEKNLTVDHTIGEIHKFVETMEKRREMSKKLADSLNNISLTLAFYESDEVKIKPEIKTIAREANLALKPIVKKLRAFSKRTSSANGLYEIDYTNGKLRLRKVVF